MLKQIFFVLSFLSFALLPLISVAQIPNPGFEQWSSGTPDGWLTDNVIGFALPVTQSTTSHSGSFALKGTVVTTISVPYTPALWTGQIGEGFPVSQRHARLIGFYQFTPVSGDKIFIQADMFRNSNLVGWGAITISTAAAAYSQFTVDVNYITGDVPDTCIVHSTIVGPSTGSDYHVGSTMLLDDLSFSGIANSVSDEVKVPQHYLLSQNYPNPFNPTTKIRFTIIDSRFTTLKVYDVLGREVATLVNEVKQPGVYNAQWDASASGLPSGIYFYKLQAGSFTEAKKMLFLK